MLTEEQFVDLAGRASRRSLNDAQERCLRASPGNPLMIVAGPGSGKTAVLVLRALRLILVEGWLPEQVVVTTFTKKAAAESRSRLLVWGEAAIGIVRASPDIYDAGAVAHALRSDVNRVVTGTLDSVCQEVLGASRLPGEVIPVTIDGLTSNQFLNKLGYASQWGAGKDVLRPFVGPFVNLKGRQFDWRRHLGGVRTIVDRLHHDLVDVDAYSASSDGAAYVTAAAALYWNALQPSGRMDFAMLERRFLDRLGDGRLDEVAGQWRGLLVDEYQDTNALQEAIYFGLARRFSLSLTVVGDDDQSLYRFRGATVELFREFASRAASISGTEPRIEYLTVNYRSTQDIVHFCQAFVTNDPDYQPARVASKPSLSPKPNAESFPVLGLFRNDAPELARDLAAALHGILVGKRFAFPARPEVEIGADPEADFGDAVLLCSSPEELSSTNRPRLPLLLRQELSAYAGNDGQPVRVFNPRGEEIADVPLVRVLLGLVLESLDPNDVIATNAFGYRDASAVFAAWRAEAQAFVPDARPNARGQRLRDVMAAWSDPTRMGGTLTGRPYESRDRPALDLLFVLISFIEPFQVRPEQQLYLEMVSRAIVQASQFGSYRGLIVRDEYVPSVTSIIADSLVPLAEGLFDIDEDLVPSVPRDMLQVMSIHQSKGLEFPIVVVDVGADYKTNHSSQSFKRFPAEPSGTALLEDAIDPYSSVRGVRTARTAMQRTYEDLIRQYFVAYSRPEQLLILVGLTSVVSQSALIRNVATFWRRDGGWPWLPDEPRDPLRFPGCWSDEDQSAIAQPRRAELQLHW